MKNKDKILTIYANIGFVSSILGIITFAWGFFSSSSQSKLIGFQFDDYFKITVISFIIIFSFFLASKNEDNDENKFIVGFSGIYSILSFLIYIISAFYFLRHKIDISILSLEIILIFFTAFITSFYMLKQINNYNYFRYYSYLFAKGVFIVTLIIIINFMEDKAKANIIDAIVLTFYLSLGIGLFIFLYNQSKENTNNSSNSNDSLY